MLSANDARTAIMEMYGETVKVGNGLAFVRGYDNISGGAASIDNFNSLMKSGSISYPIAGTLGTPGGSAGNLTADYPVPGSTWTGITFTNNGDGTGTWTGTAESSGDVVLTVTLHPPISGNVTGTFGHDGLNDAAVIWNTATYTGNRVDSGTSSVVTVSNSSTGFTIHFAVNLNNGKWTATVTGSGISSSSGSGNSSFDTGHPPALLITSGSVKANFTGDGDFTGTLGDGTITGTSAIDGSGSYGVTSGTLAIASYTNIFYGTITWGMYDNNLGDLVTQIFGRYFNQLDGNGAVIAINVCEEFGTTPAYDFRSGSGVMLLQNITLVSRCTVSLSGYIFSLSN